MAAHLSVPPLSLHPSVASLGSPSVAPGRALGRGFSELDERILAASAGVVVVRTPSAEAVRAIAAHLARRVHSAGGPAISARAAAGAPLFREVASRLSITTLEGNAARAADQILSACAARRAVLVLPMPAAGTWDRAVAAEVSCRLALDGVQLRPANEAGTGRAAAALVVLVTAATDEEADVRGERFDVSPVLDGEDRRRWWMALADEAQGRVDGDEIAALEGWWSSAQRVAPAEAAQVVEVSTDAMRMLHALTLAGRGWPAADIGLLGGAPAPVAELVHSGAVTDDRGWLVASARVSVDGTAASDALRADVAAALVSRFPDDPWAHARAAEVLLEAGRHDDADRAHAAAIARVDDALVRRELVGRWMRRVDGVPRDVELTLRVRAAERALAIGEADEAHRWAQAAVAAFQASPERAAGAPTEAHVTLLFARAAVAMGDLVAAKVALERGREKVDAAGDVDVRPFFDVELAEIAYLSGDLAASTREATAALEATRDLATRLKARNTLGKILLSEAKWDEADHHFAEDAWVASSYADGPSELRARLNRGIAILSKGLLDEARAVFEAVLAEGERNHDSRACAFALANLSVVASWKHEYAAALALAERTLKLSQHIGDRVKVAQTLAQLAEVRLRVGLFAHAEHAIAFGRRTLGPGLPVGRSAHLCLVAARIALARGHADEAHREITRAITEAEADGGRELLGQAYRVAARVSLEDGDLARAAEMIARARDLAPSEEARAETTLLSALHARASGEGDLQLASEALTRARAAGEEELSREANVLLCEIHRAADNTEAARLHLEAALALRDRSADRLSGETRAAYLARPDVVLLTRLRDVLQEPEPKSVDFDGPRTQRSIRGPSAQPRELVGDDPAIRGLHAAIRKVARANSTILIRGESGTGKELVAEAVHRASERSAGPLVTVNCAALVETLLLSELFGHEKGAFTGAFARRRGRFELAEGGTLFLDEIGDISPRTQVALLRVLQERTFERVGGTSPLRANVRIICATNRDLRAMVERGEFREDLYYRLRGITLEIPPLRQRLGDLPRISENLLARIATERDEAAKTLAVDALELLARHRWPGNVRELENALRAASLFAESDVITAANLAENVDDLRGLWQAPVPAQRDRRPSLLPAPVTAISTSELMAPDSIAITEQEEPVDDIDAPLPAGEASATAVAYAQVRQGAVSLSDMKRTIERDCIARALAETKGNITRAAALLGMKRPRLSQLVKQYGLMAVSSEGS